MEDLLEKAMELETETIGKVSESLGKIEVALSEWEAAKRKPKRLEKRIAYLQLSRQLLSAWARDSLKGRRDPGSVLSRLRKFTEICDRLKGGKVK